MDKIHSISDPITMVISEIVRPDRIEEYEGWVKGICGAARQFEGYISADVIRPRDHNCPEYVVIVKFDSYVHLRNWRTSPTYHEWIEKAGDFLIDRTYQQQPGGLEIWFTLPTNPSQRLAQPPFYKQVIVGVLGVYPLIVLSSWVLGPFLQGLPPLVGLLISVIAVSTLLTYPVMPWITQLLNPWLYPRAQKRRSTRKPRSKT